MVGIHDEHTHIDSLDHRNLQYVLQIIRIGG